MTLHFKVRQIVHIHLVEQTQRVCKPLLQWLQDTMLSELLHPQCCHDGRGTAMRTPHHNKGYDAKMQATSHIHAR